MALNWKRILLLVGICLGMLETATFAAPPLKTPLEQRAKEIATYFNPDPRDYEKVFSREFLAEVPPQKLTAIFTHYHSQLGPATQTRLISSKDAGTARFELTFAKGFVVEATIVIDKIAPHLVTGLLLGNPVPLATTIEEVLQQMKTLPGAVSFKLVRLDGTKQTLLAELNPDKPLAVGSAFKLFILSELIREIETGERKWSDVLTLRQEATSLPSGMLQSWPSGAPMTLYGLAGLMISISDNTATDHLLLALGREKVEKIQEGVGNTHFQKNIPFLTTLEMFKLKGDPPNKAAQEYLSKDSKARLAYLEEVVAKMKHSDITFTGQGKPLLIDTVEWFASASDLCRTMEWIWKHTERGQAAKAREILAINPGLDLSSQGWSYIGYKGGSEPGVLNLTYLLKSKKGEWYALSAGWNNTQEALEEEKFMGLVQRILQLTRGG